MSDYAELVERLHDEARLPAQKDWDRHEAADAINALVQERDALLAENSKLRSALEIVHFKREPWQ